MNTLIRKYRALLVAGTIIIAFLSILQHPKHEINPSFNDYSFALSEGELDRRIDWFKIKVDSLDEDGYETADVSKTKKNLFVFETYDIRNNLVIVPGVFDYMKVNNSSVKLF